MKNILKITLIICLFTSCENDKNKKVEAPSEKMENNINLEKKAEEALIEGSKKESHSIKDLKAKLSEEGYEIFDYVDEETKDTILMQKYFIAFLKSGSIRNQNEEESAKLQKEHLAHLTKMYEMGYADISGPFGDDGDIRGITIYNVPTLSMADSLANADPMVKAGRLKIEVHPWWAAKGYSLR